MDIELLCSESLFRKNLQAGNLLCHEIELTFRTIWLCRFLFSLLIRFKDNKKHTKGFQMYPDGTFYEGDWANDKRNGHGYQSFVCDSTKRTLRIYTGQWQDDYPAGFGMKSFEDGSLYKGEFKRGRRHGWGELSKAFN
jgi:hypothetical protein